MSSRFSPAQRRAYYARVLARLERYDTLKNPTNWDHRPYICGHLDDVANLYCGEDKMKEFPELAMVRPKGVPAEKPWWPDGKPAGDYDYYNPKPYGRADYGSRIVALQMMIELTHEAKDR